MTILSRDTIQITEHAVAAIAEQFDATVVGLLLRRRNMKTLWQRFHSQIESHLINKQTCIRITETAVVVALAKTRCNGRELAKLLLLRSDMKITGETGNRWCGKEMMEVLTHNNDVQITEAVIQAALCYRSGKHVVEFLFNRDGVEITAALLEKAVQHWCIRVETLEFCLYNLPMEYVLKAALATKKFPELLPIAIHEGHEKLVYILVDNGSDLTARDENTRTALHVAAEGGHLEIEEKLLAVGSNVNADPGEQVGRTALQAAAGGGQYLEILDRLLAAGSDVNAAPCKWDGWTAKIGNFRRTSSRSNDQ